MATLSKKRCIWVNSNIFWARLKLECILHSFVIERGESWGMHGQLWSEQPVKYYSMPVWLWWYTRQVRRKAGPGFLQGNNYRNKAILMLSSIELCHLLWTLGVAGKHTMWSWSPLGIMPYVSNCTDIFYHRSLLKVDKIISTRAVTWGSLTILLETVKLTDWCHLMQVWLIVDCM